MKLLTADESKIILCCGLNSYPKRLSAHWGPINQFEIGNGDQGLDMWTSQVGAWPRGCIAV